MPRPRSVPPDDLPDQLRDFVETISSACPDTVPARTIVEAILNLQTRGRFNLAQRLMGHLVIEGHGYMGIVRGLARKWARSGHDGFDEDDLFIETQIKMMEGLENGQRSALNWSSFCFGRFRDAKRSPDLNGYGGTRAKWDKALYRAGDTDRAATPDPSPSALEVLLDAPSEQDTESDGTEEYPPSQSASDDECASADELDLADGDVSERRANDQDWKIERSLLDLLAWYRDREDLEERLAYEDLERWGRRVLDGLIAQLKHPLEREVATMMFVEDPPNLMGGPDDTGRQSVAESLDEKGHVVRYRHDKARLFVGERLMNDYIRGGKLGEADAAERSLLLAWYEARLAPTGRAD